MRRFHEEHATMRITIEKHQKVVIYNFGANLRERELRRFINRLEQFGPSLLARAICWELEVVLLNGHAAGQTEQQGRGGTFTWQVDAVGKFSSLPSWSLTLRACMSERVTACGARPVTTTAGEY